jgi:phosphoribosylformylglycinamidine synthase
VFDDVAQRVPMGFAHDGDAIILIGDTYAELSGSEWAWVTHGHLGGLPPRVDLARERALASLLAAAAKVEHISAAHDLSDGGLAQALVESCLRHGVGARLTLPEGADPFVYLFSESTGRALVAVPRGHEKAFTALCTESGLPWTRIGVVDTAGGALEVRGEFAVPLDELRAAWSATLPALFDPLAPAAPTAPTDDVAPDPDLDTPAEPDAFVGPEVAAEPVAGGSDEADDIPPAVALPQIPDPIIPDPEIATPAVDNPAIDPPFIVEPDVELPDDSATAPAPRKPLDS